MLELTLASINCRGLSDLRKRRDVLHFIRSKNYDLVFIQETHLTKESLKYFNSLWRGKCHHACHSSRSRGVSILIKDSIQHELIKVDYSDSGNFIIIVCKIGTQTYTFANIYGPNDDEPSFYENFARRLESFQTDYTIIGGDFNFVILPEIDSFNYAREYNTNAKQVFLNFAQVNDLVDIWRVKNPNKRQYTWSRTNPLKSGRLDMFFINAHLAALTTEVDIEPGYRTDHNFATVKLSFKDMDKGPGIWKMNDSVLQDSEYADIVNETIKQAVIQYAIPLYQYDYIKNVECYKDIQFTIKDSLFYETLLMLIRGETVRYCKNKARSRRRIEELLAGQVDLAQNELDQRRCTENIQKLNKAKEELEKHRAPYIDGLIVRSRTQWHEEGERNTKYFLSLEKRNATNNI